MILRYFRSYLAIFCGIFGGAASGQVIQAIAGGGPVNLPALQVGLGYVQGLGLDGAGNLFFVSSGAVYKLSTSARISRFAGLTPGWTGDFSDNTPALLAVLPNPTCVAVDGNGNVYIGESSQISRVSASTGAIVNIAGSDRLGPLGDGGLATAATFNQITGLALDSAGNLYVADSGDHRIRMIAAGSNIVSTVAGNGTAGYSGDGQAATSASLNTPTALAFDTAGNLYIADMQNNRIRKVSQGTITTYAGNGNDANTGDGGPSELAGLAAPGSVTVDGFGNLYVVCGNLVRKIAAAGRITTTIAGASNLGFSGDGGNASSALLNGPQSILADAQGSLLLTDSGNLRIRKINSAGIISTIGGNGTWSTVPDNTPALSAPIRQPVSPVIDGSGNLLFTDGNTIRKVSLPQGTLSTVAGNDGTSYFGLAGYPAISAGLSQVTGLAIGPGGAIYFINNPSVLRIDPSTGILSTVVNAAGTWGYSGDGGPATAAMLSVPSALAFDSAGNLYIADEANYRIRKVSAATGNITTIAGNGVAVTSGDNGPAVNAGLAIPHALAIDATGNIYLTDGPVVRKISATTGIIATVAGNGTGIFTAYQGAVDPMSTGLNPYGIAVDASGTLFIADLNGFVEKVQGGLLSRVAGYGSQTYSGDGGPPLAAGMFPTGIAVDHAGNIFITDGYAPIRMISSPSGQSTVATNPPGVGITVDGVYYSSNASFLWMAGSTHAVSANSPIYALSGARYSFGSWSDGGAATHTVTAQAGGGTYTANYSTAFPMTLTSVPYGAGNITVTPSSSDVYHNAGNVQITAAANSGYKFASFSGDVSSASNPYSFNLAGSASISANFTCNPSLSAASTSVAAAGGGASAILTDGSSCAYSVVSGAPWITVTSAASGNGSGTVTMTVAANAGATRSGAVTIAGLTFTVTQAAGVTSSNSKVGVFQSGNWFIDANGNGQWDGPPSDRQFTFTAGIGDIPVTGDWNGDGRIKAGVYHNGFWLLDYNGNGVWDGVAGGDRFIALGGNGAGEVPVVGDWNGSGTAKVGVYYKGFWTLDKNGNGVWDGPGVDTFAALGGTPGETPVIGDWNGDGRAKIGVFVNGSWALDYNGNGVWDTGDKMYTFSAGAGDVPVVGDWSGSHTTKIGVYHNGFWLLDVNGNGQWDGVATDKFIALGGNPGETPVVGDWNGSGTTKVGFFYKGFWALDYNGNGVWDGVAGGDRFVALGGAAGEQPVVAKW